MRRRAGQIGDQVCLLVMPRLPKSMGAEQGDKQANRWRKLDAMLSH
jgi:hypothetical protein